MLDIQLFRSVDKLNIGFVKHIQRPLVVLLLCLFGVQIFAANFAMLTVEAQQKPLAVDNLNPRFSWAIQTDTQAWLQSAYAIELKADDYNFNTGKVASSKSNWVQVLPEPLAAGKTYQWRLRVWDKNDVPTQWSAWQTFTTAPAISFFDAQWIGAIRADDARLPVGVRFPTSVMRTNEYRNTWNNVDSLSRRSIVLRRNFNVEKTVTQALVYVCGLGHYELTLNGKKVGDSEFAPMWSDYSKTVYYNTYDISNLLQKGDNAFGVLLGNGFYNAQGGRYSKLKVSFGAPTLMLKALIRYSDNSTTVLRSDEAWKYDMSPITFNDIYGGEDYDARLEQKNWDKAGFDDTKWKKVVVQDAPHGKLKAQQAAPVKAMEFFKPIATKKLSPAEADSASRIAKRNIHHSAIVLDMGQNLAGFPQIKVRGKRGDRITLVVAEALTPEGAANQRQTGRQHLYHYTLSGNGIETWQPRFSYYGFRYIQVEGAVMLGSKNPQRLPIVHDIQSCFVYNSATQLSQFECSNEIFNQTHRIIQNAVKSNMQAVFTDCPHREKLGWLEQVHLVGPGILYNFDLRLMAPKIMRDIADAQHASGKISTTAPIYTIFEGPGMDNFEESPEWSSTFIQLPWMYASFYGDSSLIHQYYQPMRRYVDYLATRAEAHILSHGLGDWYDYGDFKAGFSRNTPVPLVATAYYYSDIKMLAQSAKVVGNWHDEKHYTALAEEVKQAFNHKFFDEELKTYGTGSQAANAIALHMGLVPQQHKSAVLQSLTNDIAKRGNRLTTGDVGNRYLFQTLADNNLNELMYLMHNHEDVPGYGFQLKFGATTLTEQWDPRMGSSWNHFMMGQIDEWFFNSLAGIRTKGQGFANFVIAPQIVGDLQYVKAKHTSPYGDVKVHWQRHGNALEINVEIPPNCKAELILPNFKKELLSGKYFLKLDGFSP